MHLVLLLEEPSSEAFFRGFLPRLLPDGVTWQAVVFQGKADLLSQLEKRLKGYKAWMPTSWRIIVVVDEDREDCRRLKQRLEAAAHSADLPTKAAPRNGNFTVLNRIVVEELEAWFFGDPSALASEFEGVAPTLGQREPYRDPDRIAGGTWESLERVLQKAGHYPSGISKIDVARRMATRLNPAKNTSQSFRQFVEGVASLQRS